MKGENLMKISLIMLMVSITLSMLITGCDSQKPHPSKNVQPKQTALQPKEINQTYLKQLDEIKEWAQKGMVEESPFNTLESTMNQVNSEWGEPDKVDQAGAGSYATYNNKQVVIGYNKAGEIFDIRSYADYLNGITDKMVVKSFGQPMEIRDNTNEMIYVYKLNDEIQLKVIIQKSRNVVDHISVFNVIRSTATSSKNKYILDIKGNSNQLSESAWVSMKKWRKDIVLFAKNQDNVYINGPDKKQVALTFDDGPDEVITPAIIEILANHHVKGNFFFIGSKVNKHPDVVKAAFKNGNLVLSHSFNHVELTKLGKEATRLEIEQGGKAIKSVIGKEPAILRTPYGDTNRQVADVAKHEGYSIVLWSIDTLDWSQRDSKNIIRNVIDNLRNGDIILMHSDSDKSETKKALPLLIEELQKRNIEIVDLETLLDVKAYK
jgi:peptidoglycan/xylan/chitin deacetylase (PgdA/CDA1 family)